MFSDPSSSEPIAARHTIETPEQMTLAFAVAGIGSRFLAVAVDSLIQVGAGLVLLIIITIASAGGTLLGLKVPGTWAAAAGVAGLFLLMYGYFALFEILWNGQTPGKRMIGIRVVKDTGRPLTPPETIGRNLMRLVDQLPFFYAVGIAVALTNAQNRRLGDFVAGSLVVREGKLSEVKPVWQAGGDTPASMPAPAAGAAVLTVEELALVDAFLNRRSELTANVRAGMAAEILKRLGPRFQAEEMAGRSAESILETLAYQRRSSGAYL